MLGWGLEETGGTVQTILQEVDLIVFSDEDCRRRHDDMIYPSHICGGVPEGGRGQCSVSDIFKNIFLLCKLNDFITSFKGRATLSIEHFLTKICFKFGRVTLAVRLVLSDPVVIK